MVYLYKTADSKAEQAPAAQKSRLLLLAAKFLLLLTASFLISTDD